MATSLVSPSGPYLHQVMGRAFNAYKKEVWHRCSANDRARLVTFAIVIDEVFKADYGVTREAMEKSNLHYSFAHGDLWVAFNAGVFTNHQDRVRARLSAGLLAADLDKDQGKLAATQRNWSGFTAPTADMPAGMFYISFRRSLPL